MKLRASPRGRKQVLIEVVCIQRAPTHAVRQLKAPLFAGSQRAGPAPQPTPQHVVHVPQHGAAATARRSSGRRGRRTPAASPAEDFGG